jgi:DNA invertase Pin-like site-specific DNA recombinase
MSDLPPLLAAVYPRVSSEGQKTKRSIIGQYEVEPVIRSLSATFGRPVVLAQPPEYYSDDGKSAATGKLGKRAGYARLLRDAAQDKFELVIVFDLDRLSRTEDLIERAAILGPLQRNGIKIADRSGAVYDLNTFQGDLFLNLKAAMGAADNARRTAGCIEGRKLAARAGKPPGMIPYGFVFDAAGAKRGRPVAECWAHDPIAAPIVREIFIRIGEGESCETIAADFHRRGVKRARSTSWHRGRVHVIATSSAYRGEWDSMKGQIVRLPSMVDDDLWNRVQLALRKGKTQGLRRTKHVYLAEGIARCACGGRICIHSTTAKGKIYRRYVCQRRLRGAFGERCEQRMLDTADVDARLWASVRKLLSRSDLFGRTARHAAAADVEAQDLAQDLDASERKLAEVERRMIKLAQQYAAEILPEAAYEAAAADMAERRKVLQRQIDTARQAMANAGDDIERMRALRATIEQLRAGLEATEPGRRRDLVRALVPGVGGRVITLGPGKEVRLSVVLRAPSLSKEGAPNTTEFECDYAIVA